MISQAISAYLGFVQSAAGAAVVILLSVVACVAIFRWSAQRGHVERRCALVAAGVLTVLVAGIYGLAVAAGWWAGVYFETPLLVQVALLLPLSVVGWLAWLMGYAWLAARSSRALWIYVLVALLLVAVAAAADRMELAGGLILIAEDGQLWGDALIGVAAMLMPLLLYEGFRRGLSRDVLP
jgi:hypothetical protein